MKANTHMIGGSHYSGDLQHWDYVTRLLKNRYLEGCATKYLCRPGKGQELQDARKAVHYMDKLIEEYKDGRVAPLFTGEVNFSMNVTEWADSIGLPPFGIQVQFLKSIPQWSDLADLQALRGMAAVRVLHLEEREKAAAEAGPAYVKQE
jgi:hypothetical protein